MKLNIKTLNIIKLNIKSKLSMMIKLIMNIKNYDFKALQV